MTQYPAILLFELPEPRRQRVIDAARSLGLAITFRDDFGDAFKVHIPTPQAAYDFGVQCIVNQQALR